MATICTDGPEALTKFLFLAIPQSSMSFLHNTESTLHSYVCVCVCVWKWDHPAAAEYYLRLVAT